MKVLITGASGFIGSFMVGEALKRNFEVYAGIRSSSKKTYLTNPDIHFFDLNLADKESIKTELREKGPFDYVIHNAGITQALKKSDFEKVNFQYTQNFIEALIVTNSVREKFIFISSLAAYGPGDKESLQPIEISDTPKPITYYGKSKLKAEKFITSLSDFPYLIFRPTAVYGPREKDFLMMYKSIKRGIETYIGTQEQHLTFIYVKDLVRLIFDALESNIIHKSYFATDLKYYTAKAFNSLIKDALNTKTIKIHLPKNFVRILALVNENLSGLVGKVATLNTEKYKEISSVNWLCNSSQTIDDFDFTPKYDLKSGLKETIEWYQKNQLL